jgi:C4-type Zn-finger protein
MAQEVFALHAVCGCACPACGSISTPTETVVPGFTGAPIYVTDCPDCGYQDVDASADSLEAVR